MDLERFKPHCRPMPWTVKTEWQWPKGDKKLVLVFDHVADIDGFMQYVDKREVCIQAGGACGVWPYRFAQLFENVYTFEPQPENFACLMANCDLPNITAFNAPLSNDREKYTISNDIHERENFGAGYAVRNAAGLEAMMIDDLKLDACDLIQLDIEGFERNALLGGSETIARHRPVIVLEEKPLNHLPLSQGQKAREWLQAEFGYKQVDKIHWDVILTC